MKGALTTELPSKYVEESSTPTMLTWNRRSTELSGQLDYIRPLLNAPKRAVEVTLCDTTWQTFILSSYSLNW